MGSFGGFQICPQIFGHFSLQKIELNLHRTLPLPYFESGPDLASLRRANDSDVAEVTSEKE